MPVHVALATSEDLPSLAEDDQELGRELEQRGVRTTPAVWSDLRITWSSFDAVVIRSTWGYYRRIAEYLDWVERVSFPTPLWNPRSVVTWNSHKSYLLDLERAGVPVVPTVICRDPNEALATIEREGWGRAVVKPAVSAGAYRTHIVHAAGGDRGWVTDLVGVGQLLVQPYQENVERSGERSFVFFRGKYSHAFLRAPRLRPESSLVEGASVTAAADELEVARRALARTPAPTLYGRVDLVRDSEGSPRVMELEVIEPALALRSAPGAAGRFADAVLAVVRTPPSS